MKTKSDDEKEDDLCLGLLLWVSQPIAAILVNRHTAAATHGLSHLPLPILSMCYASSVI